jgi:hypothetical protein
MHRITKFAAGTAALALLATAVPATALAQADTAAGTFMTFFKRPVFVLQPGGVTANAISAEDISAPNGLETLTNFNARFSTIIPTSFEYWNFVFGTQVAAGGHAGTPNIFYGGIIPIVPLTKVTQGWLDVSLDPLGVTTFGGTTTRATGGTFFFAEGAVVLQFGRKMMAGLGPTWSGIGAYFLIDQQISGPLPLDENGDKDHWRPVLLYGLNIPLGS